MLSGETLEQFRKKTIAKINNIEGKKSGKRRV
jgi:hypothetical protein